MWGDRRERRGRREVAGVGWECSVCPRHMPLQLLTVLRSCLFLCVCLQLEKKRMGQSARALKKQVDELKAKGTELEEALSAERAKRSSLRAGEHSKRASMTSDLARLKKQLKARVAEITQLRAELQSLEEVGEELHTTNTKNGTDCRDAQAAAEHYKTELKHALNTCRELNETMALLEVKYAKMTEKKKGSSKASGSSSRKSTNNTVAPPSPARSWFGIAF